MTSGHALVSSLTGSRLPAATVYFGEIGLSGAVRPVVHGAARLKEAAKLGFEAAVGPDPGDDAQALPLERVSHIAALVAAIAADRSGPGRDVAEPGARARRQG